ncbi:hypothetical protein AZ09_13245 [Acetobacter aceti 1023]|nr:hypothetical protein AZ09_13245 [Acetobacter aceti 1023]
MTGSCLSANDALLNHMLPAQVRNRDATFSLMVHTHDLGISKAITLHQNLIILMLKKFSFKSRSFLADFPILFGG